LSKKLADIREVFKSIKHQKRTQYYCPRCCSPKLKLTSNLAIWLTAEQYYCEECGYVGTVVMVLEKEKTDSSSKESEENKEMKENV
jgi:ribosomal protein L37AE/L43A